MVKSKYKKTLDEDGIVQLKDCISLHAFKEIESTILNLFIRYGGKRFLKYQKISNPLENLNFNKDVINLRKKNKKVFGVIYDVLQNTVSLNRFFTSKQLITKLSKEINLSLDDLVVYPLMVRIDVPHDERNFLDWHQDNLIEEINQSYKESITLWIPLSKVNNKNGSIEFCLKSHNKKYFKNIKKRDTKDNQSSINSKTPDKIINQYKKNLINANKGDVIVFSMNTLHKSVENLSNKVRFTLIARFHDIRTKSYIPGKTKYFDST